MQSLNSDVSKLTDKGVDIKIYAGSGHLTPDEVAIARVTLPCQPGTEWTDGEPASEHEVIDGDGRVLLSRVGISGVEVLSKTADHSALPDEFRAEIVKFLRE